VPLATNLASAEIVLHHLAGVRRRHQPSHEPFPVFRSGQVLQLPRDQGVGRRDKVKP
jgi:hypothetical protein